MGRPRPSTGTGGIKNPPTKPIIKDPTKPIIKPTVGTEKSNLLKRGGAVSQLVASTGNRGKIGGRGKKS